MYLNYNDSRKLMKQIEEGLKNPVGIVPTPKLHLAVEKIRKDYMCCDNCEHSREEGCLEDSSGCEQEDGVFIFWEPIKIDPEKIDDIFEEANEYDVEKIKRKLDMFLKTNDLQYLGKVLYLTKELIKEN